MIDPTDRSCRNCSLISRVGSNSSICNLTIAVGRIYSGFFKQEMDLSVGFDQPLKLAPDTNSLKLLISSRVENGGRIRRQ
jgi:hypothetical protein